MNNKSAQDHEWKWWATWLTTVIWWAALTLILAVGFDDRVKAMGALGVDRETIVSSPTPIQNPSPTLSEPEPNHLFNMVVNLRRKLKVVNDAMFTKNKSGRNPSSSKGDSPQKP